MANVNALFVCVRARATNVYGALQMEVNAEKIAFVSGHGGTSVGEIAAVLVSVVAGYALRNVLLVAFPGIVRATRPSTP